jgi:hypothetical protein
MDPSVDETLAIVKRKKFLGLKAVYEIEKKRGGVP